MNPLLIKALIEAGLQVATTLKALKSEDPAAFEAALEQVGADHKAALERLEAAVAP